MFFLFKLIFGKFHKKYNRKVVLSNGYIFCKKFYIFILFYIFCNNKFSAIIHINKNPT